MENKYNIRILPVEEEVVLNARQLFSQIVPSLLGDRVRKESIYGGVASLNDTALFSIRLQDHYDCRICRDNMGNALKLYEIVLFLQKERRYVIGQQEDSDSDSYYRVSACVYGRKRKYRHKTWGGNKIVKIKEIMDVNYDFDKLNVTKCLTDVCNYIAELKDNPRI